MTLIDEEIIKHNLNIRGILHIGAYIGEEIKLYNRIGVKNVILFEPQKSIFYILQQNVSKNMKAFNIALGNYNGVATLNISYTQGGIAQGSGASSSILKPAKHLQLHPNVLFTHIETVQMYKLDDFIQQNNIDVSLYNMINIDVQGYELEVFKGAVDTLPYIDYIVSEVNRDEVYESCVKVDELDTFLYQYRFTRVETNWAGGDWGDALYIKESI